MLSTSFLEETKGSSNQIKPKRWPNTFSSKIGKHSEVWGIPLSIKSVCHCKILPFGNTCHHNGLNHLNITHIFLPTQSLDFWKDFTYSRILQKQNINACLSKWNLHGLKVENIFKQIYNMQADKAGKRPFKYIIKN